LTIGAAPVAEVCQEVGLSSKNMRDVVADTITGVNDIAVRPASRLHSKICGNIARKMKQVGLLLDIVMKSYFQIMMLPTRQSLVTEMHKSYSLPGPQWRSQKLVLSFFFPRLCLFFHL